MRIEYIKLKNYRQYIDEKIDFTDSNKDISVIEGAMDSGKSSILNAITWCLYGEEIQLDKESKGYAILNMKILNKMKIGDIETVEVEIRMKDDENNKHTFIRKISIKKTGKKESLTIKDPLSRDGTDFKYLISDRKRGELTREPPEYFLEQIMPSAIKQYFFFDGDQLNLYFKEASGEKIKNAVFDISQISLLDDMINRLRSRIRELLKDQKGLGSNYENNKDLMNSFQKSLDDLNGRKKQLILEKEENSKLESKITEDLVNCGNEDVEKIEKECISLDKEIKRLKDRIGEHESEKNDHLVENAPFIICYNKMFIARNMIEKAEIPSPYKKDYIESLLKKGFCMCGINLKKNKDCEKELNRLLLKTSDTTNIEAEIIDTKGMLRGAIDDIENFLDEQKHFSKGIDSMAKELDTKNNELEKNNNKIKFIDKEKYKKLKTEQIKYKSEISRIDTEIGEHNIRILEATHRRDEYNNKMQKALDERGEFKKISNIINLLDDAVTASTTIREKIVKDVREKIKDETKKQFLQIHWKEHGYKDINITENYDISILDPKGWETKGTISKGTRQVLALSFLAALNSVSGFKAPIVIDTPLGRISNEPKLNIIKYLSKFLPNRQIILLMTDSEYTENVRKELKPRINKEYKIKVFESEDGNSAKVTKYD